MTGNERRAKMKHYDRYGIEIKIGEIVAVVEWDSRFSFACIRSGKIIAFHGDVILITSSVVGVSKHTSLSVMKI